MLDWREITADDRFKKAPREAQQRMAEGYFQEFVASDDRYKEADPELQSRMKTDFMEFSLPPEPEPGLFSRAGKAIKDAVSGIAGERTWTGGTDTGDGEKIIESGATETYVPEEQTAKPSISGGLGDRLATVRKMSVPGAEQAMGAPRITEAIAAPEEGQYAEGIESPAKAQAVADLVDQVKEGKESGKRYTKDFSFIDILKQGKNAFVQGALSDPAGMVLMGQEARDPEKEAARMEPEEQQAVETRAMKRAATEFAGKKLTKEEKQARMAELRKEETAAFRKERAEATSFLPEDLIVGDTRKERSAEVRKRKADHIRRLGEWIKSVEEKYPIDQESSGIIEDAVKGMMRFGPTMGISAIAPPVGFMSTFAQIAGMSYNDYRKNGVTPERAAVAAMANALVQTPLEFAGNLIQIRGIARMVKALGMKGESAAKAAVFFEQLLKNAAAEGTEEYLQQYPDEIANHYVMNPDESPGELARWTWDHLKEVHEAGLQASAPGAVGGALLFGLGAGVGKAYAGTRDLSKYITDRQRKINEDREKVLREGEEADPARDELVKPEEKGMTPEEILTGERKPAEEAIPEVEEALGDQRTKTGLILDEDEAAAQFTPEELERAMGQAEEMPKRKEESAAVPPAPQGQKGADVELPQPKEESQKEEVAGPRVKEPWEMTKDKYVKSLPLDTRVFPPQQGRMQARVVTLPNGEAWQTDDHGKAVFDAVQAGKDVPPEVLGTYPELSAEYEKRFVKNNVGSIDLGTIPEDVAESIQEPAAPVRMQYGNADYGAIHVGKGKGGKRLEAITKAGYPGVIDFVGDVAKSYTQIWKQPNGRLMLVKKNGNAKVSVVELVAGEGGDFYGVTTALVAEAGYPARSGRKLLWEGREPASAGPEKTAPLANATLESDSQVSDAWRSGQSKDSIISREEEVNAPASEKVVPAAGASPDPGWDALDDDLRLAMAQDSGWGKKTAEKFSKTRWADLNPTAQKKIRGRFEKAKARLELERAKETHAASPTEAEFVPGKPLSRETGESGTDEKPVIEEPPKEKQPEKALEPAPPAPTPPAEEKPKEGAATLAGHGLSIKKTATKKGSPVWEVSGDTKPHKDRLKALGGKWFGPKQAWSFYKEDPTEKILGVLEGKNQETTSAPGGKPEIEKTAETDGGQAFSEVALRVSDAIAKKEQITWQSLFEWGDKAFGGTQAEGKYTPKDAYDAMEMGINKYLSEKSFLTVRPNLDGIEETQNQVKALKNGILEKIPTQSKRTEEQDEFQQFSTPPPFAFLANWVANIGEGDTVLEPSAGTGNLAVFAKIAGANVVLNELSKRRAALLRNLNLGTVYTENAEHLHAILPKGVKPTVVVMNPPFSATAGRIPGKRDTSIGAEHVEQALKRLEPGGRLVAVVGKGMAPDAPAFREWWKKIKSEYKVLANVGVSGDEYRKYGTTFDNRLIVIDKTGKTDTMELTGSVDKVEDLVPLLKGVRDARTREKSSTTDAGSERTAAQPGRAESAAKVEGARGEGQPVRAATGGVGTGEGRPGGPVRSVQPGEPSFRRGPEGRNEVPDQNTGGKRGTGSAVTGAERRPGSPGVGDTGSPVVQEADRNRPETLSAKHQERELSTEELSDNKIFDEYKPQETIEGAKSHPGKLEESAAMAAVPLPRLTYALALPKDIVGEGRLSDAQLEAVLYAGHSHRQFSQGDDAARMGFFVGDGTGVGKGREIAAIIWDNYLQGRKKAVWITQNQPLINDAKRDVEGVGWNPELLIDFGKTKLGSEIKNEEGIAFLGYGLLASKSKAEKDISRVNQLAAWLGEDFDGVIVFDEAHNMGNAIASKGTRGTKKASLKALAGIELQARFPKARIVYVSATGATEVSNLSYCDRLGLWGYGTAFADKRDFVDNIAGSGVAAMEMVAQNLKAMGRYMARSLSFDGVSYSNLEHPLTEDQRVAYDKAAEAWQVVLKNVHEAIEKTKAGKQQKANAMSAFWGSHQRFFNQIITSMQMPTIIKSIERDLADGHAPVLQLVNTNEAQLNRALQDRSEDDEMEDLDLTPLEQLIGYVQKSFPVYQYTKVEDADGNVRSEPVYDSEGNRVENPEAVAMRERLLEELESLKRFIPDGPLDMLVNHFGHENIAEVTGRTKRLITITDEKGSRRVVEKWSKSRSMVDADAFQNDKKHILVFSQAGGTGRSYHADLTAKNQRLRKHYLVQPGWRADVAVQGFGRSHRSNQAQPPEYVLATTDLKGQKRFISSVARRLDQLGALTKGQRQTGAQGFFGAEDNLENIHAHHGLGDLIYDVYGGKVPGISIDNLEAETGLKFTDKDGNLLRNPVPPMTQFLNRILSMKIETQNRVFDLFAERMRNRIERARAEGTLDVGLETVRAKRIDKLQEVAVHTDEQSGAETKYMEFEITNDAPKLTFENSAGHAKGGYARNNRSGRVYAVSSPRFRTDPETGEVVEMVGLLGANYSGHNIPAADLNDPEKYSRIAGTEAKDLWETELNALPSEIKSRRHLVTGALLPIWDRLPADEIPRIFRLRSSDGQTHLGRLIPEKHLQRTLERLGASATAQEYTPAEVFRGVYDEGKEFVLANDWTIRRRRVSGDYRIELVGPFFRHDNMLKGLGVFMERIQHTMRYFIPVDPAKGVRAFEGILKQSPVVNARGGQQEAVETLEIERYSLRGSSPQGKSFAQQLDDFQAGKLKSTDVITVGETPTVLEMLGADQLPLVVTQETVRKALVGKHKLYAIEALKKLPSLLEDPIMIFESTTQPDSLVVMTEWRQNEKTIVAAIHLSKETGRNVVNEIASIHPRTSDTHFVNWIHQGRLRYMNKKKSREWTVTSGLQLPGVRGAIQGFKKKILFEYDLVKKKNELDALRKESGIGEAETVLSEQDTKALLRTLGKRVRGLTIYTNDEGVTYIRTRGGKRVAVKTVRADRLKPDRAAVELYDEENRGGDIRGGYSNKTKTIYLAKGKGDFWTLTHEFYHFLEDAGVVSAMDREILTRHIRGLVKKGAFETRNKNDIGGDEDRAFFAETRLAGEPYDIKSPIGRILENIREFIDTIINALGIRTARGVMRDIRTGKIHDRGPGEAATTGKQSDIRYRLAPAPAAADSALPEHVRERWEQSRGVPRRPVLDWAREKLQHFKEGTAHFPALQRIADKKLRGALSDLLRTHQEIPQYASEIAIRRLGEWTGNLAPGQSNIYEENIILADLVRDIESGLLTEGEGSWLKEGPFGFRTTDEVRDAFDKAQEMAGRDQAVSEALKKRAEFIRELKQDLVDHKILKPEVLDSQDYYHHQVLIHWGDFRGTGTGSRDVRKHWRPWMAARTGSVHDYNTQYFEAEFTAIAQQLAQVETARTLKRLKEMADEYDACKKKEKAENRKLFYRKWSAMHGGATVIPGDKDTDPLFQFKQKIAMAAGKLEKMAKKGELKYDSEWSDIIDRIAAGAGVGEPRFFHFLSHLMNRKDPGALQAATIFKAIQDRNKMIDEALGKDKLAWQHFIPEGYIQWKPDPNKGWFWANTYTDAILQKIAAGEIRPEDAEARKVLAKGRAYIWVIPEGLAETLDKFNPTGALGDDAGMLARLAAKSLAAWKQYILINPVRVLKYNTNNASGDGDICIAYAPEILKPKYGHKAMTDLVAWHRRQHDKLDPDTRAELEKARRLGVLGSGFAVQEVEDVMKIIPDERHLKNLLAGEKLNVLQKYWQGAREFTTWRENILRLAAYRFFRDSLEKGKKLYGASNPAEIDAIADPDEKAAKLARELLGDYGNISAHGQYIRKRLIPFYSWCVPAETEILTRVGWKKKDDLMIGEEVLTYNMITRTTEWQPVEDKAEYPFDGELVTLTNAYGFKYQFTEDHRVVVIEKYKDKRKIVLAKDLKTHHHIPLVAPHVFDDQSILSEKDAGLLGWLVTDGYTRWRGNSFESMIYQAPGKKADDIRRDYADYISSESIHPDSGVICFRIKAAATQNICEVFKSKDDLPRIVTRLSRSAAEAMCKTMLLGDGDSRNRFTIFTQNEGPVLDAFQILCYRLGKVGHIRPKVSSGEKQKAIYVKNGDKLQLYKWQNTREAYSGIVWCPKTPNGTWVMRQNGKVMITGNCEINAPRYVYMLRNLKHEDRADGSRRRMTAVAGRKMLAGGAKFALRAGLLYGAVMLYNAIVWPDEEEQLGEIGRQQLHLILGRREDGTIVTLRFQGALSDALAWFGAEDLPRDIADLTKGKRTLQEKLIDIPKAVFNRIVQGVRPDLKVPAEVAFGQASFPDVTRPRPIYDTAEHILRTFSLDAPYRWIAGKPKRGGSAAGMLFQDIQKMLLYEADPSEQAYYDIRRMVNEWNEKRGKAPTYGGSPNRKGKALYYYKQALRYGDFKAAEKYLSKYQALGGNWKGLHQSIRMAHPLAGVKQELRYNFRKGLNETEEATLQRALEFYRKHYLARGGGESATGR